MSTQVNGPIFLLTVRFPPLSSRSNTMASLLDLWQMRDAVKTMCFTLISHTVRGYLHPHIYLPLRNRHIESPTGAPKRRRRTVIHSSPFPAPHWIRRAPFISRYTIVGPHTLPPNPPNHLLPPTTLTEPLTPNSPNPSKMVRVSIAIAAAATLSSASIVHQLRDSRVPTLPGPDGDNPIPDANRECTANGAKCAGAENFRRVEYRSCCNSDDLVCGTPKEMPSGLWGNFCIKEEDAATVLGSDGVTSTATSPDPAATGTAAVAAAGATTADDDDDKAKATPAPGESPDPEVSVETSAEGDGSVCFPADATVELESGAFVRMDELSVGDMVKVGVNQFSRVFMFTHKLADAKNNFVTLNTAAGAQISLTPGHYLYANGALVAAKTVVAGDELTLGNGDVTQVTSVASAQGTGLFNPQTVSGNVVVNGVQASTYTTAVEPSFAHAVLSPFRALQNLVTFTGLESGGGALADVAPRGQAVL